MSSSTISGIGFKNKIAGQSLTSKKIETSLRTIEAFNCEHSESDG